MSERFDDPEDSDDDEYFAELDDGVDTGRSPKFFKVTDLDRTPTELSDLKVGELFSIYIGLRNQLKTDRTGWKAREAKMKAQMLTIGSVLLNRCTAQGVDSFRADTGSGYKTKTDRFKVAADGWESLTAYVRATGNFQVLQRRVSADAVREIKELDGEVPPGIEVTPIEQFVVRSPTARRSSK